MEECEQAKNILKTLSFVVSYESLAGISTEQFDGYESAFYKIDEEYIYYNGSANTSSPMEIIKCKKDTYECEK